MLELRNYSLFKNQAYIDGKWVNARKGRTFGVANPFDQQLIAKVPDLGVIECKQAIDAAYKAFEVWKEYAAGERAQILRRWYELQMENLDDLAKLLTIEQGKPLAEAKGEIRYGASFVEWYAEEARRIYGDVIPGHGRDKRITVIKQPVGVVGAITPWNFPNAMITRKVAPALAAACTVVIKPSELTPLSALALAELGEQAGFPPGVLNIITTLDAPAIGEELTSNPKVKKISFTGSTAVGKILLKQSADFVKKVSLELGGNAPFIVFEDADIDAAVEGAIASKFRNAGQTCVCSNRIFAQAGIYDEFILKLSTAISKLKMGNGLDEGVNIGPMITYKAVDFVDKIVKDAKSGGANIMTGGKVSPHNSLLYEPTLITHPSKDMMLFNEEIFGPIAPVFSFDTEEEVIKLANDTQYGLASYFYGRDYARIWRVAEALEYGMVGINTGMISTTVAPFGGIKESGIGREGSKYGIDEFVNMKYMCWGGIE
ncbi:MAG: NAD-dependent succinate-semialdehyde dehydrogenase [Bacteroidia bacterium]|nr:NAD-dependent succinate-semialdehyde dehydrogenase [Bacteroidia bacterium]